MHMPADQQILQYGLMLEELRVLKSPGNTAVGDVARAYAADIGAEERHPAVTFDVVQAADQVQHRRLAGTVGPDDAEDFAALDIERDVTHGVHAAEAETEPFGAEDRVAHFTRPVRR